MGDRTFGEVEPYRPGAPFSSREAVATAGLHRPHQHGISGSEDEGADSIVVSGGYEDDEDFGDEIVYTGHGGRDAATGKQIADQTLTRQNLALARSRDLGLPVRVIRGANAKSAFAPRSGYRYDGLYSVEDVWSERGKSGFIVIRYRLLRAGAPAVQYSPASPTTPTAPSRRQGTVLRIVRDTSLSRAVKELYGFACQVCGITLTGPSGPYAEAAHIRPLGEPHNGPDIRENILCLCPNHHVLFDLGGFTIADDFKLTGIDGALATRTGHRVNLEYVRYHREHYGRLSAGKRRAP